MRGYSLGAAEVRERSDQSSVETGSESRVQQHFREEVDVNTIVRRFGVTGVLPMSQREGLYGDFSGISDLDSAIERVDDARRRFAELPAEVRDAFGNDLVTFWRAAQDMDDVELESLGKPAEKPEPAKKPAEKAPEKPAEKPEGPAEGTA